MQCMSPVAIYWDMKEKKYSYRKPVDVDYNRSIVVPCGKCPNCKKTWRTQLAQRVRYELDRYNYNEKCFLTLTVNETCINKVFPNGSLSHVYFQKFIKRLRRYLEYHKIPHKPIKYFMCGEYGADNGRPHFHVILFGWKPKDLKYAGTSYKGYKGYKSELLQSLWSDPDATKEQIKKFNNDPRNAGILAKHGGKFKYLPFGFIDVGDISEETAPYMAKYIMKFSEVPQKKKRGEIELIDDCTGEIVKKEVFDEFTVNGRPVRKPYLVYPKKILGIDYFLENYKQILKNGYILDSRGKKHGIPRSFLKYAENQTEDILMSELYKDYRARVEFLLLEEKKYLISQGYVHYFERYEYYCEQGRIKREIYNSFKNKHR